MFSALCSQPLWVVQILQSICAVLFIWLVGKLIGRTLGRWLIAWAEKIDARWGELVVRTLRHGIPIWSLLFGLYVATGFWTLPDHLSAAISRMLFVLGWLSVTMLCAGLAGKLIMLYAARYRQALPVTSLTEQVAKILVVLLGGMVILHGLGISIAPLLTALGVGGLAVALALQDTLANLFAGLYLTIAQQIRVGDYVQLETGQEGYVDDIGWRATSIRILSNNMVIVPNKKLSDSILVNYYLPSRTLAVLVEMAADYHTDLARVEHVTQDVARQVMQSVPGGVPDFAPLVRFHTFGESAVQFTVVMQGKEFVDQYLIKHEFMKRLLVRYQQEGMAIPYPIRTIRLLGASTQSEAGP